LISALSSALVGRLAPAWPRQSLNRFTLLYLPHERAKHAELSLLIEAALGADQGDTDDPY